MVKFGFFVIKDSNIAPVNDRNDDFRMQLDDFDKAILRIVQKNNQLTHAAIGEEIGLSNSAVRRRLKLLRDNGIIAQDVSILGEEAPGITVIVSVTFETDSPKAYAEFDKAVQADRNIKQAYHVSGTTDYVLVVQGPTLAWYEQWAKDTLMRDPNLKRHETSVVYSCKKFATARAVG